MKYIVYHDGRNVAATSKKDIALMIRDNGRRDYGGEWVLMVDSEAMPFTVRVGGQIVAYCANEVDALNAMELINVYHQCHAEVVHLAF